MGAASQNREVHARGARMLRTAMGSSIAAWLADAAVIEVMLNPDGHLWTDRHARYFLRLISPNTLLYTEMITTGALLYGPAERYLAFDEAEHPVALQLGGSDPDHLAQCAEKTR